MKAWFKKRARKATQLATGLAAFSVLAGLAIAYVTPVQSWAVEHPLRVAVMAGFAVIAMAITAYVNVSRYVFLVAIPLVLVCVTAWVVLTAKTIHHVQFYTTVMTQSASRLPDRLPGAPAASSSLSSKDRKDFERAARALKRSPQRLQHHLDRHAFWTVALLTAALCSVAAGFLPRLLGPRSGP